jgi:hypothetical protein
LLQFIFPTGVTTSTAVQPNEEIIIWSGAIVVQEPSGCTTSSTSNDDDESLFVSAFKVSGESAAIDDVLQIMAHERNPNKLVITGNLTPTTTFLAGIGQVRNHPETYEIGIIGFQPKEDDDGSMRARAVYDRKFSGLRSSNGVHMFVKPVTGSFNPTAVAKFALFPLAKIDPIPAEFIPSALEVQRQNDMLLGIFFRQRRRVTLPPSSVEPSLFLATNFMPSTSFAPRDDISATALETASVAGKLSTTTCRTFILILTDINLTGKEPKEASITAATAKSTPKKPAKGAATIPGQPSTTAAAKHSHSAAVEALSSKSQRPLLVLDRVQPSCAQAGKLTTSTDPDKTCSEGAAPKSKPSAVGGTSSKLRTASQRQKSLAEATSPAGT